MATITNKEVLQSYIITTAKYDFSVYEKRILYKQIEIEQELLSGQKIRPNVKIDTNLWKDRKYTMPVQMFLNGEEDKNYARIKKAFKSLMSKIIEYEDENKIVSFPLIMNYEIDKKGETVTWQCYSIMVDAIVNFAKGFRKYELKTAMSFDSIYAMRFYEIFSGQERPLTFTIDQLKAMFKLENKYSLTAMFIKKVIDVAKKELDKKSPYSFEYKKNKQGKKFHSITFYPTYKPEYKDLILERRKLQKQISLRWDLSQETINYLKEVFLFDSKEINQHRELFKLGEKELDLLIVLSKIKRYALDARNPKGYVISALKKELEAFKQEEIDLKESEFPNFEETTLKPMGLISDLAKKMTKRNF